jgi:thiamine biosynthesis lipoprotein
MLRNIRSLKETIKVAANVQANSFTVEDRGDHLCGRFSAMASPCELLFDCQDHKLVHTLSKLAFTRTKEIEHKYSRYLSDNLMSRINSADGQKVDIDQETYRLLVFADTCYQLSDGLFDITSGVLRKAWKFDGSDNIPPHQQIEGLLAYIGWDKIQFDQQSITLPPGFELDFGGIGKEYAVDAVAGILLAQAPELSVLINFGGDIQLTRPRANKAFWQVGIEDPNKEENALRVLQISSGGLATSGDSKRFLLKDGERYSHILNPKTGYPICNAARSVTVAAQHCVQAGLLATLALLQGAEAENFLAQQGVKYWCYN